MLEVGDKVWVELYDSIGTIVNTDFRPTLIIEWSDKTRSKVLEREVYSCPEIRLTKQLYQNKVDEILKSTESQIYIQVARMFYTALEEELFGGVNDG